MTLRDYIEALIHLPEHMQDIPARDLKSIVFQDTVLVAGNFEINGGNEVRQFKNGEWVTMRIEEPQS